jgi:hypothetical protein
VIDYVVLLAVAVAARLLLPVLAVEYITPEQRALWSWPVVLVLAVALAAGAVLAGRARLPTPREGLRSQRGPGLAVAAGVAVGALTIASDVVSPAAAARGLPTMHVHGLAAVPFYLYGALLVTVIFHFLPVAAGAWLAHQLPAAPGRAVVLAVVLLVAFSEDAGFFARGAGIATIEGARHALSVAANATEAALIYRFGLAVGLLQRGTTYLLWHVAWPIVSGS